MIESTESAPLDSVPEPPPAAPKRKRAPAKKIVASRETVPAEDSGELALGLTVETAAPIVQEPAQEVTSEAVSAKTPAKRPSRARKPKTAALNGSLETPSAPSDPISVSPETSSTPPDATSSSPEIPTASSETIPDAPKPVPQPGKTIVESHYPPYQKPNFSQPPPAGNPARVPSRPSTVSSYPPYQGVTKVVQSTSTPLPARAPAPAPIEEPEIDWIEEEPIAEIPAAPGVILPPYEPVYAEGLVEISGKGFGFLREPKRNYAQSPSDVFVTPEVVRRYLLRDGQWVKGEVRRGSRGSQLFKLTSINNEDPERYPELTAFEELTSINPDQRIKLETVPDRYTTRVIDLITPIGKGQRGLIVAPPRTGKTTLLQHIAEGVIKNHPSMKMIILLVDERPEEVTEIRRGVPQAEIMASSNDNDLKAHTRIVQLAIERAKRLVEAEEDVFILLDSITRVARAFNNATAGGGRTGSGGLDTRAMEIPRKLFAAARNTEQAGSLTIIATALIDTGSLMDEVIFQEFKGTGNMELVLDRKVAELRIYPAIDIFKSGTRREELLLTPHDLAKINTIRRGLSGHRPGEAIERLLSFLRKFPTNAQMLREIPDAQ